MSTITRGEILKLVGGDLRKAKIAQTIVECQNLRDFRDFIKKWDEVITELEQVAFHKGVKQAEKILKRDMRS